MSNGKVRENRTKRKEKESGVEMREI